MVRAVTWARVAAMGLGCSLAVGCSDPPTDETPSGTVRLFLEAMDRSSWDSSALEEAFSLLAPQARTALAERAKKAASLSGQELEPWDMIAQGRYRLRFAPRGGDGLREQIDGDQAVVTVVGGPVQRADVPLVREGDRWRIVLDVPALSETSE